MINLLPPSIKTQLRYGQRNVRLLKYVVLVLGLGTLLCILLFGGNMYARMQIKQVTKTIESARGDIKQLEGVEEQAKTLNDRLSTIQTLFDSQSHFSRLVTDIANSIPSGAALTGLNLGGDEKAPLLLNATADSQNTATILRNQLAASARFSAVDIQSLTLDPKTGRYSVSLLASFNPGAAR